MADIVHARPSIIACEQLSSLLLSLGLISVSSFRVTHHGADRSSSGALAQTSQSPISPAAPGRLSDDQQQSYQDSREQDEPARSPRQESAAAEAERHRTRDGSVVDLQALVAWIECNILFALILLNLFITLHWAGVAIFASMTLIIALLNRFLRHQIGLKEGRSRLLIAAAALYTVGHATTFASPSRLILSWQHLTLLPQKGQGSAYTSVWQCFYDAIMTDALLRFATVTTKLLLVLFSRASPEDKYQQRSRALNAAEHVSVCLRIIATTPFWFHYFQTSTEHTFFLYTGVYLCLKIRLLGEKGKNALKAVQACWSDSGSPFGTHVTADALLEEGQTNSCPICQEAYSVPLQLSCKHVFCNACISEWLERESTCPMCRAQIKSASMTYKDGAVSLLPQVF